MDPGGQACGCDGAALDYFGYSLFISGDIAVVRAHGDDDMGVASG